jgi:hypothetical protein
MGSIDERVSVLEAELNELRTRFEALKSGTFDLITLTTGLNIVDKAGRIRATFRLIEDGLGLALWTAEGKHALSITCDESRARISFDDSKGQIRADIKLDSDGEPIISLNDENGDPRLSLSVLGGAPRIMFHDQEELRLALGTDPAPSLEIYDAKGIARVGIGLDQSDFPILVLNDPEEQVRLALGLGEDDPAIVFYDQFQSVIGMINEPALELMGLHANQQKGDAKDG